MKLGIYGAGGMGAEILELAKIIDNKQRRWDSIFFISDISEDGSALCEMKVLSFEEVVSNYSPDELEIAVSVGEPLTRRMMADKIEAAGFSLATLIYPRSPFPYGVVIEEGVIITTALVGVGSFAHIGKNVMLQGYSNIGHGTTIGANTNVSCFAQVAGNCKIGENVFIGIHSVVKEHITIGDNAIIGMCAPVFRDVPKNYTVFHATSKMVRHEEGTSVF